MRFTAVLLLGLGWALAAQAADFDDLRQLAEQETLDPALGAYTVQVRSTLAERQGALLSSCPAANGITLPQMVVSVDAGGEVSVVGSSTDNTLSRCLTQALEDQTLPAPPQTPFLALVTFDH